MRSPVKRPPASADASSMRRWFKREKEDLVELAIVFGAIVLMTGVSMLVFGGQGAGAGAAALGASMAARRGEREAEKRAAGEPRGRLTIVGMRQAAFMVWATLLAMLVLAVAIQHRAEDPLAFVVVLGCFAALLGWTGVYLRDSRR
ncbi:MAG TPA: hypothetical protein VKB03_16570 [Conexibacter sp.]|nr:hypothetical protein [Conexibacter sp.]